MKVLIIGPSTTRAKGGMSTMIKGITNYYAKNSRISVTEFPSYIEGPKWLRWLYFGFAFLRFITTYRGYDIYHLHMASFGSERRKSIYVRWLKRRGKRVIVHLHGGYFFKYFNRLAPKRRRKLVQTLQSADLLLALSQHWKAEYESKLGLTNVVVLNNGIDPDAFASAVTAPNERMGTLLVLGKVSKGKGTFVLLEALTLLQKRGIAVTCYIAGDGDTETAMKVISRNQLIGIVKMVGWINQQQKLELLKKSSVVVLPSYNEGLPMALLEGMAAGKAIISTPVGAIPELIEPDVNGLLVPPGDALALADAIARLSADVGTVERMAKANREKINKQYNIHKIYHQLTEYYRQVMGGNQ